MSEVWAVIVSVIVLMILYAIVSSRFTRRRQRRQREKSLPFVKDGIRQDISYNVFLNDGKKYLSVQLAGTVDSSSGQFAIGGSQGMLVFL